MLNGIKAVNHSIRWGMVGGGATSQIGYNHRSAALRDNNFTLVAGAFDIDSQKGKAFGSQLGLDEQRCYADYKDMFIAEAKRTDGIQAVSVATPNSTHYQITKAAIESGLHVVCEKPLCFTLEEAQALEALSIKNQKIIGITYGYAGHQMIQQARSMVAHGDLGKVRAVHLQFSHGFNSQKTESDEKSWRVDPKISGPSFVLGDLATHPLFLAETIVPSLKIQQLLCERQSFVKSRAPLEDNAYILMKCDDNISGFAWCSAINSGSMHGQKIRIIGEKASIEWWDERPNQLLYEIQGQPVQILERGMPYLYAEALEEDRMPGGHVEGLFEAWANLYRRFARAMEATDQGDKSFLQNFWYPDIHAGLQGVKWIEKAVESADSGGIWVDY